MFSFRKSYVGINVIQTTRCLYYNDNDTKSGIIMRVNKSVSAYKRMTKYNWKE